MAEADIKAILRKAVVDETFRLQLSRDVDKALENHQLNVSADERKALRSIDWGVAIDAGVAAGTWVHVYKS